MVLKLSENPLERGSFNHWNMGILCGGTPYLAKLLKTTRLHVDMVDIYDVSIESIVGCVYYIHILCALFFQ